MLSPRKQHPSEWTALLFKVSCGLFGLKVMHDLVKGALDGDRKKPLRIAALRIYPIKSCAGIDLKSARLTRTGFADDRQYVLVTPRNNLFATQRTHAKLTLVKVSFETDASGVRFLRCDAPGMAPAKTQHAADGELCQPLEYVRDAKGQIVGVQFSAQPVHSEEKSADAPLHTRNCRLLSVVKKLSKEASAKKQPQSWELTIAHDSNCRFAKRSSSAVLRVDTETSETHPNVVKHIVRRISIWRSKEIRAVECPKHMSDWFSKYIGIPLRLLRCDKSYDRTVEKPFLPLDKEATADGLAQSPVVGMADGYPSLLVTQESVDLVNEQLLHDYGQRPQYLRQIGYPLSPRRFRPNIIASSGRTAARYIEYDATEFCVLPHASVRSEGNRRRNSEHSSDCIKFIGAKPCERCSMPRINEKTAVRHFCEPSLCMRKIATIKHLGVNEWIQRFDDDNEAVFMGINLLHFGRDCGRQIRVGQFLKPMKLRTERPVISSRFQ